MIIQWGPGDKKTQLSVAQELRDNFLSGKSASSRHFAIYALTQQQIEIEDGSFQNETGMNRLEKLFCLNVSIICIL